MLSALLNSKLVLMCWFIIRNLFYDLRSRPTLQKEQLPACNMLLLLTFVLLIVYFHSFFGLWINDSEWFHRNRFLMCILMINKDDSVSSAWSELLLGILSLSIVQLNINFTHACREHSCVCTLMACNFVKYHEYFDFARFGSVHSSATVHDNTLEYTLHE